jgi:hypothetical protein
MTTHSLLYDNFSGPDLPCINLGTQHFQPRLVVSWSSDVDWGVGLLRQV